MAWAVNIIKYNFMQTFKNACTVGICYYKTITMLEKNMQASIPHKHVETRNDGLARQELKICL